MKTRLEALLFVLFLTSSLTALSGERPQFDEKKGGVKDTYDTVQVEQVSITSLKSGKDLFNSAIASTTISSKDLRLHNVTDIKDLSLSVPNLFMPNYGTKLTSPLYIRGVGSRINSPSVGLYVDGIPYFEKSSFDFDFQDVNQVEVLRGPQGTLYGRNTMGGIINVLTRTPLSYEGTNLTLGYSTVGGNYDAAVSHFQTLNENWGFGIAANYEHSDGYFYNDYLQNSPDQSDQGGLKLKLRYLKDNLDINLSSSTEYSFQNGYPYQRLDAETLEPQPIEYNSPSMYERLMNSSGVVVQLTKDKYIFTSRTSYQYIDDHQGIDQDFSNEDIYYINQFETHNIVSQELQFSSNNSKLIDWVGGVFGFYQSTNSQVKMDYLEKSAMPNITTDKYYQTPKYGIASFGQGTLNWGKLAFSLGVRYDVEFSDIEYNYYRIAGDEKSLSDNFTSSLCHTQLTPKFSLEYNFQPNNLLYATVTKGFKSGGFNTSFESDDERSYLPEQSWNYELGGKFATINNKLSGSLALFYIEMLNQQVYQPLASGKGSLLRNAAQSYSTGVELALNYKIISGLNLSGSYGYTEAKFKDYKVGDTNDYSGNSLPYVPQNTLSLALDYTISAKYANWYDRMNFSVQYNGLGGLYWNDSNKNYQKYYSTLNSRASISKKFITLAVWCKNITSAEYAAFYFEALGNSYIQRSKPITVGVDLALNF